MRTITTHSRLLLLPLLATLTVGLAACTDEVNNKIDQAQQQSDQLRQQANKAYYSGQLPPMNILNPAAWAEFIRAWKRGDFKKKD